MNFFTKILPTTDLANKAPSYQFTEKHPQTFLQILDLKKIIF